MRNAISKMDKKRAMFLDLTKDFEIRTEAIICGVATHHEAVSQLTVREIRMQYSDDTTKKALLEQKRVIKCTNRGKKRQIAKNSWSRKDNRTDNNITRNRYIFCVIRKGIPLVTTELKVNISTIKSSE